MTRTGAALERNIYGTSDIAEEPAVKARTEARAASAVEPSTDSDPESAAWSAAGDPVDRKSVV